ncbi:MAG: right-handed parallel beta-helix repeat-containing protein [Planctomycetota bacterium]
MRYCRDPLSPGIEVLELHPFANLVRLPPTDRSECNMPLIRTLILALCLMSASYAASYQIDFDAGDDSKDGLTAATAFKHCPGDTAATGLAAATKLQPGDTVIFKGGVIYRGEILVGVSGEAGKPIVFDGNTAGTWGSGKAIIDGSTPLSGWKRCASAEEAKGNPRWADIFYVDVPRPKNYKALNLSDSTTALPIAQHPNPKDFFWQEHKDLYLTAPSLLKPVSDLSIATEKGTKEDRKQPISNLLTGNTAVVSPGSGFTYTLGKAAEISAVGFSYPGNYSAIKNITVFGDGKELLNAALVKDDKGKLQRFELPAPVTVTKLTFKIISFHDGEKNDWTKVKQVAAFDSQGINLLKGADTMTFTDPEHLNQPQADWYDGMTFAFHAGNNGIFYLPIKSYDPATSTLTLPVFGDTQYKKTTFCLFNSVRLIDQPGEYSVENLADPKLSRIFLLPPALKDDQPNDIGGAVSKGAFTLSGASHIAIQGFVMRRQNDHAIYANQGNGAVPTGLTIRDCEMMLVMGTVISGSHLDSVVIDRCHIHDNPGHTKGVVLHTCTKSSIRNCRLVKNTSTALDFYTCSDSEMVGNTVLDNLGSHANGLTLYVGCKNILIERNKVAGGNCALTFQQGENFIFRNNYLDGSGNGIVVGIWPSQPLKNVQFINNTIVRANPAVDWTVGMFSNSRKIEGLVVKNNIIDGLGSDHDVFRSGTFSNNLYTRLGSDQTKGLIGTDELVEKDLKKVFVDAEHGDFRLCAGGAAIGAGTDVGVTTDIDGQTRPTSRKPDLGAYAFSDGK